MRGRNTTPVRTVVLPFVIPSPLLRALFDVRSGTNRLLADWRAHPEEGRFASTKRAYPPIRTAYPHLGSKWVVGMANEASASLRSWDRWLRRMRRVDPVKWALIKETVPHRRRLKANVHRELFRLRAGVLEITIHRDRHTSIDLSVVRHPLFEKYLEASGGDFGLTITDRQLLFQFRVPLEPHLAPENAGIDLNMPSADFATSDGQTGSVDLRRITAVQGAMARKRASISRHISKDLRHQRAVLRRYHHRERNRVRPLLHAAANQLLSKVGDRNLVLEDLSRTRDDLLSELRGRRPDERRRLSSWTQGELQRILRYKSTTHVVHVNPRGTSSECPNCGGSLTHPSWRKATCENCQEGWHRDRAAAMVILSRGQSLLRGAAPPPSAPSALLEAARWRSEDESPTGPVGAPRKGDDAKLGG